MGRIGWSDVRDAQFPAAASTPRTITNSADGILQCYGKEVPADGATGYAPGCIFLHVDGSDDEVAYLNQGSKTSCDFEKLDTVPPVYGTASGRGPSPEIWDDCPVLQYTLNPTEGWHFFDDFLYSMHLAAGAGAVGQQGIWSYYADNDTEAEATVQADDVHGELLVVDGGGGADNNAMFMCLGGNTGGYVKFNASAPKAFWFEARIKATLITDSQNGIFCGFMEEGLLGSDTIIADGGTMADKDYVGFHRLEADGDKLDIIHNIAAGGHTTLKADAITLVADTWKKVGMKLDTGDLTLKFYDDGVQLADTVEINGSNFPNAEELCFYFGCKAGENADNSAGIDWVRIAQAY